MSPFFSIVIPVYNVAPYLRECLDSVLAQTFGDWEAICVDDGSTDGSGMILDEYAVKDERFRVIHQQNQGVGGARNKALALAQSDWILFLDADDVLREICLADVKRTIELYPDSDAVHFDSMRFTHGEIVAWPQDVYEPVRYAYRGMTPEVFNRDEFCCKAYSRSLIGDVRFTDRVWGEDRLFLVTCMARADVVSETGMTCYGYRQRNGSAMHSEISVDKLRSELWLLEEWRLWRTNTRNYPKVWWRKLAQAVTEFYAEKFFSTRRDVQSAVWLEWKAALIEIAHTPQFPIYNRIVLCVFAMVPCRASARILFYLPQWLKRRGLHR